MIKNYYQFSINENKYDKKFLDNTPINNEPDEFWDELETYLLSQLHLNHLNIKFDFFETNNHYIDYCYRNIPIIRHFKYPNENSYKKNKVYVNVEIYWDITNNYNLSTEVRSNFIEEIMKIYFINPIDLDYTRFKN